MTTAPTTGSPSSLSRPHLEAIADLEANVSRVVRGKPEVIRYAVVGLLAGGHLLVEDVPGVGKTTLAQALARSVDLQFQRVQFTSDLLPSDIIGVSIFDRERNDFRFRPGPLFTNVLLADEINRATPKTQSALLEAMSESTVSVERQRFELPSPFLVIATQNPLEHQGTFPLPESQLDRFLLSLEVGYPRPEDERELLLSGGVQSQLEALQPVLDGESLAKLQRHVTRIHVASKLADYMLAIAQATRTSPELSLGVSTRGLQGLFRATQAMALCQGRDFATPDDVIRLAAPALSHRIVLKRRGDEDAPRKTIEKILSDVPVPT
ncbi:MAG: MoxR family ATPase [Acidobacteriota bacterium]